MNSDELPESAMVLTDAKSEIRAIDQHYEWDQPVSSHGPRSSSINHQNLELHIGELVLDDFSSCDRYLIGAVVERELTNLFIQSGAPLSLRNNGEIGRLDGGVFEIRPDATAESIGAQVAQAIFRAMANK